MSSFWDIVHKNRQTNSGKNPFYVTAVAVGNMIFLKWKILSLSCDWMQQQCVENCLLTINMRYSMTDVSLMIHAACFINKHT